MPIWKIFDEAVSNYAIDFRIKVPYYSRGVMGKNYIKIPLIKRFD